MTIRLPRVVLASTLLLALAGAAVLLRGTPDAAAATGNKVVCVQVQQMPGRLAFVAQQVGRTHIRTTLWNLTTNRTDTG